MKRLLDQSELDALTLFLRGEASPPRQLIDELRTGIPELYEELAVIVKAVGFMDIERAFPRVVGEMRK